MTDIIQAIECPCGKTFAALSHPSCLTDEQWLKDVAEYQSKGCKTKNINMENFEFQMCNCGKLKKSVVKVDQKKKVPNKPTQIGLW